MACSAATSASLTFSIPTTKIHACHFTPLQTQPPLPNSLFGLRKPLSQSTFNARSINARNRMKSFVVRASSELPLVGNVAPDFEDEAVFDQEFIKVKLSEYIGKKYVILFFHPLDLHLCLSHRDHCFQ